MEIFGFLDTNVLPFFLVVNAFGILYKKWTPRFNWLSKLKDCIPIPVVVTLLSVILCGVVGLLTGLAEGTEFVALEVFRYVVGNGLSLAFISIAIYDTFHSVEKTVKGFKEEKKDED